MSIVGLDTNTVVVPLLAAQDEVGDSVEDEDASVNVLPTNNMERTGSYYNHVTTQLSAISGASPRRKAALSSAQQWLGVVKDTIELERNVVVEVGCVQRPWGSDSEVLSALITLCWCYVLLQ